MKVNDRNDENMIRDFTSTDILGFLVKIVMDSRGAKTNKTFQRDGSNEATFKKFHGQL